MTFYKSMFRTIWFWLAIFMWGVCIYCFYGIVVGAVHPNKHTGAYLIIIFFALCALMLMILGAYYIMIEKEKLIIKNAFCSLFDSTFRYEDIKYIEITIPSMRIGFKIHQKRAKSKFYPMDSCVHRKDYPQIIKMLQAKGVEFKMPDYLWKEYWEYLQKQ